MTLFRQSLPLVFLSLTLGLFPGLVPAEGMQTTGALSLGYRLDSLDWNINGENNPLGSDPNILSELEWRDLDIVQLKATIRSTNMNGIVFRGNVNYGWVQDGVNQDSDYAGSNRTLEFSRSINGVDGSRVMDLSGGLGSTLYFGAQNQYQIIPIVGYAYHSQDLRMTSGNQVFSSSANFDVFNPDPTKDVLPVGPFSGLNSHYDAEWFGPWFGADFVMNFTDGSTLLARVEAHSINYFAQANWNLRQEFAHPVSFEHKADGQGRVLELGWQSASGDTGLTWGINVVVQSWTTNSGTDRVYYATGGSGVGKLNEVNWSSRSINFTLQKAFAD